MDGPTDDEPLSVEDLAERSAGETGSSPYEEMDTSSLPEWWRRGIEAFETHGLRPYRPPRFADGTLKYEVVEALERRLDVGIRFQGVNVTYGDEWTVLVDDEAVGTIGHRRDPNGYSVFEMTAAEFRTLVGSAVDE